MAKKAKRRGRPPGSKNKKKSAASVTKNLAKMEIGRLRRHIDELEDLFARKVQQQKEIFEGRLSELQDYVSTRTASAVRTVMRLSRTGKRAKAPPKYQSKKKASLKWSGRGMLPIWMREEMAGTRLTKDDFLISKGK